MSFSIRVSLDSSDQCLLVLSNTEAIIKTKPAACLEELRNRLLTITEAAQKQMCLRFFSLSCARELDCLPIKVAVQESSLPITWLWKTYSMNGPVPTGLHCMIKLVKYFETQGKMMCPILFRKSNSRGSVEVRRTLQTLESLLSDTVEGPSSSRVVGVYQPASHKRKQPMVATTAKRARISIPKKQEGSLKKDAMELSSGWAESSVSIREEETQASTIASQELEIAKVLLSLGDQSVSIESVKESSFQLLSAEEGIIESSDEESIDLTENKESAIEAIPKFIVSSTSQKQSAWEEGKKAKTSVEEEAIAGPSSVDKLLPEFFGGLFVIQKPRGKPSDDNYSWYNLNYITKRSVDEKTLRFHLRVTLKATIQMVDHLVNMNQPLRFIYNSPYKEIYKKRTVQGYLALIIKGLRENQLYLQKEYSKVLEPYEDKNSVQTVNLGLQLQQAIDKVRQYRGMRKEIVPDASIILEKVKARKIAEYQTLQNVALSPQFIEGKKRVITRKYRTKTLLMLPPAFLVRRIALKNHFKMYYGRQSSFEKDKKHAYRQLIGQTFNNIQDLCREKKTILFWEEPFTDKASTQVTLNTALSIIIQGLQDNLDYWRSQKADEFLVRDDITAQAEEILDYVKTQLGKESQRLVPLVPPDTLEKIASGPLRTEFITVHKERKQYHFPLVETNDLCSQVRAPSRGQGFQVYHMLPVFQIMSKGEISSSMMLSYEVRQGLKKNTLVTGIYQIIMHNLLWVQMQGAEWYFWRWINPVLSPAGDTIIEALSGENLWQKVWQGLRDNYYYFQQHYPALLKVSCDGIAMKDLFDNAIACVEQRLSVVREFVSSGYLEHVLGEIQQIDEPDDTGKDE